MKTFLIERNIPNAGKLSDNDLKKISRKSCDVLDTMDSSTIQWINSYVAENKVYCIYKAIDKSYIEEHARQANFPVNQISKVSTKISPETVATNIK